MRFNLKMKALILLLLAVALLPACSWRPGASEPTPTTTNPEQITVKPQPRVVNVTTSTAGFFEDYYAIVDAEVKNDGAEGIVLVIASMTQAGSTSTKRMPITMGKGEKRTLRFIFPIKWEGGEWTPKVTTELP